MAYLNCPWCLTPQSVSDDVVNYLCFSCYADVRFFECPECKLTQTVGMRWEFFTCSRCDAKVRLPAQFSYGTALKARAVKGTGHTWPQL
jgi:hypothetical protein